MADCYQKQLVSTKILFINKFSGFFFALHAKREVLSQKKKTLPPINMPN